MKSKAKSPELNKIINADARIIDRLIKEKIVDVVITSPPYFDLKDYGSSNQIGFGQDYQSYLNDLKKVFTKVYSITKDDGSLWVIIDVFRKDGELLLLPFDFASKIKQAGWILQDIIIWNKDKTVPWVHDGQMRNLFEYVLVFSKQKEFRFYIDRLRDWDNIKKWWVKYPERYNPKGKAPSGVWQYGIPTQGAWGNGYIRHFCPLPEELVENIIKLSTNEGDLVLDPFAGTGTVLSKAEQMGRKFIGTELNNNYILMFDDHREKNVNSNVLANTSKRFTQESFEKTILQLRALKFGKILLTKIGNYNKKYKAYVFVESDFVIHPSKNKLIKCLYSIYVRPDQKAKFDQDELLVALSSEASKPPLSKFGIDHKINIYSCATEFQSLMLNKIVYKYTLKNTHHYECSLMVDDIVDLFSGGNILSETCLEINEADFE